MMNNPWEIYDALIEGIPEGARSVDCQVGVSWTMVRSDRGGKQEIFAGGRKVELNFLMG